ncbi:LOW QUALITY PROTEIN: zinc finger HIT domain-containing protein 3 [Sphaerodactylus townsendi]|uniref:LOW QUALITY PROTEIN: zinc finger HIT domain-containing protein 3 n=1 Tax=Sphaerodactylus townsendi TaxID=933632 RepID=UPI0020275B9B|nr:LOW QUALITY PROTEIN: zinc finger HIT domain-containing protein 3 [Sphaerodactylus townsendi]
MQEAERCGVCPEGDRRPAKYRCPGCRARYCSVPCYKKHKEQCVPKVDPVPQPASAETLMDVHREKSLNAEARPRLASDILTEDEEEDKVPLQTLQQLNESEELQGLLLNPHLRQLLLAVDQAADKNSLMQKHMQEPLFVEFVDCCLQIVEPPEKENEVPE